MVLRRLVILFSLLGLAGALFLVSGESPSFVRAGGQDPALGCIQDGYTMTGHPDFVPRGGTPLNTPADAISGFLGRRVDPDDLVEMDASTAGNAFALVRDGDVIGEYYLAVYQSNWTVVGATGCVINGSDGSVP